MSHAALSLSLCLSHAARGNSVIAGAKITKHGYGYIVTWNETDTRMKVIIWKVGEYFSKRNIVVGYGVVTVNKVIGGYQVWILIKTQVTAFRNIRLIFSQSFLRLIKLNVPFINVIYCANLLHIFARSMC